MRSPFSLDPVGNGWRLTDDGQSVAHLALEDFDFTENLERIARLMAESAGLRSRDDLALEGGILESPTLGTGRLRQEHACAGSTLGRVGVLRRPMGSPGGLSASKVPRAPSSVRNGRVR